MQAVRRHIRHTLPPVRHIACAAGLLLALRSPAAAHAATFAVATTTDAVDDQPGDGRCATATGECTLRAAVQEANFMPDQDIISVPAGTYTLTLTGAGEDAAATGDLDILGDLTLTASGAAGAVVIRGEGDRVLDIFSPATVTISGIVIQNGDAAGSAGGGIRNAGALTLTGVALAHNTASDGGGLANVDSGSAQLTNVTISTNTATAGGAIANLEDTGRVELLNVTMSANSAATSGSGIDNFGTVTLENTIVANSVAANCHGSSVLSLGHNLETGSTCLFDGPGDLSATDPALAPVQDNGGFTQTQALLPGSPAIDAGDNRDCPATDQRGEARPADGDQNGSAVCDIGAYEVPGPSTPTPTEPPTEGPTGTASPTATLIFPTATPTGPAIELSTAVGNPGDQVTFAAILRTAGADIVDAQNDITFDPITVPILALSANVPDCTTNPDIEKPSLFQFLPRDCTGSACTGVRAYIFPLIPPPPPPTPIPSIPGGATLYTCRVHISPDATPGAYPLVISKVILDNAQGTPIPDASGTNGAIIVSASTASPTATPTPTDTPTPIQTATATPTLKPTAIACTGDCNGDREVTVDEVITMVNNALDGVVTADCAAADPNTDGEVTIDEILTAVNNLLDGCRS
jgi:CSLREA domain-containing protein